MALPAHLDLTTAWSEIRAELREALGESMYSVWIEPLELDGIHDHRVVLRAPVQTRAWIHKRYGRVLHRCVRKVLGADIEVSFAGVDGEQTRSPALAGASPQAPKLGSLNPRYSFDQFIIGDGNRLAHAAALAVAELPGQTYNPLFLHAPPGLGKTHLLHAIGNYIVAFGGGARVRYTTTESFTNNFIASIASRSVAGFKELHRETDVLLIDDVQFLASKAKTEEEFFHTFNALYENGRQLVLTCDRLPSQLEGIAERLRERFEAGLVADISPPDLPTRLAILRKRAALDGLPLEDEAVLEFIAQRVTDNVRALEGALIRVVAYHSLTGQPITPELAAKVLDGMHYTKPTPGASSRTTIRSPGSPTIEAVQEAVSARYELTVKDLVSPSRTARLALPRQLAIYLARELTSSSLSTIGAAFGGRTHATALHACKRATELISKDQQLAVDIDELSRNLSQSC